MTLSDYSKTRQNITRIENNSDFGNIIKESIDVIHALELFYYVGLQIRPKQTVHCPLCLLLPKTVESAETLSEGLYHYEYKMDLGIGVKNPNDYILAQELLGLETALRTAFSKKSGAAPVLIFDSVTGHFNTQVGSTPIALIEEMGQDVLLFSSGVELIFSVRTLQT